ncbi:hypothetical protein DL766_000813 [Monosporascus sp. MC13-8B]|uniref:FAD-binding PCMH-type domain-containing protein n=1 Tax=Monosporascus cannonballus TaxID=155416 RepID=A0ABY0HJS9_9PEZI|nr:hypothetical protein DL762_001122 [Monosporascus cannonballus]RYO98399.1 hypothetical protein DL763_002238 [Monosporascus cannonballus]RYP38813.1 hypothetical protein DL766_000813 [Monosporascus sp. MC13-8B]
MLSTVGGKLVATVPIASPCHDTFPGVGFDAGLCAQIQADWARPELHDRTAHSPMAAFFANLNCDPFTPRHAQCVLGTYVPYAVNASGASDYRETIAFDKKHNIRLVICNTSHDYMGKSTGPGLGGPGSSGCEGLAVVEGDCPTVSIAGSYTQGGGTSSLGSKFGLAADRVLEWEVITGKGELLTTTPRQNSDLYWALAGGGGGTYGVVLSMTVKLHSNMPTAGATLSFTESSDAYWDIVQAFLLNLPEVLDTGATLYWLVLPGDMLLMPQSYFPGGTSQDLERLLQPALQALDKIFASTAFQDAYHGSNPEMNITELNLGGRLIPRSLVASDSSVASLTGAIKSIISKGGILAGVSMDISRPPTSSNAVHQGWCEALFLAVLGTVYDRYDMTANIMGQQTVTKVLVPTLEDITPGGAAYLNEAEFNQPNWQRVFYGTGYPRL